MVSLIFFNLHAKGLPDYAIPGHNSRSGQVGILKEVLSIDRAL